MDLFPPCFPSLHSYPPTPSTQLSNYTPSLLFPMHCLLFCNSLPLLMQDLLPELELSCSLLSILKMPIHPLRQQKTDFLSNPSFYLQNELFSPLHSRGLRSLSTNRILFFFFFYYLYWSIIALQWCVSFCYTTK